MKSSFYTYLFQNKKLIIGISILILFSSVLAQLTPYIQGLLVDNAILSQDLNSLITFCIVFVIVLLLDAFAKFYLSILTTNTGYTIAGKIRKNVFALTINRPYDFFENQRSGDILHRTNAYIYNIGNFISTSISDFVISLARSLIIFTFMFVLYYKLALVLATLYFISCFIIYLYSKKIYKLGKIYKKYELHRNSLILQNLEGMETYLAYNDNFDYLKNYKDVSHEYGRIRRKYYWYYNTLNPVVDFVVSMGTVLIYNVAFNNPVSILEIGIVVSMLTYASRIIGPIQLLSKKLANIFETRTIVDNVFDLATPFDEITEGKIQCESVDIRCENLSYKNRANGANFENVNVNIKFGENVLLYGKYGTGKTSFANLLTGLYRPDSGKIYFNDVDMQTISKKDLGNIVSVVSDNSGIFKGSIYQNVRFANPNATEEEIMSAIKKAGLMPWIETLDNKHHTRIAKNTVSEGDKQLIAFARLILKNTPIVIFDEFSRDLDDKKEKLFLKNLEKFAKEKTLIYIVQIPPKKFPFTKKIKFSSLKNN